MTAPTNGRPPKRPLPVQRVKFRVLSKTLYSHFEGFHKQVLVGTVLSTIVAVLEVAVVFSIAALGPMVTSHAQSYSHSMLGQSISIGRTGLVVGALLALVLRGVVAYLAGRYQFRISGDYGYHKRLELLKAFTRLEWNTQATESAGAMYNGVWSNVTQARQALQTAFDSAAALVGLGIMMVASFAAAGILTALVIVAIGLMAWIVTPIMKSTRLHSEALRVANNEVADDINEVAAMAREIRVFGVADPTVKRSAGVLKRLQDSMVTNDLVALRLRVTYSNVVYMSAVAGLGILIAADTSNPTPYAAMVLLLFRGFSYGMSLQSTYQQLVRAYPYIEAVDDQLVRYAENEQLYGSEPLDHIPSIVFDDVSYSYQEGRPVISDLSFTIGATESVGIVGPSGGGKSTLVQLLLRLRSPDEGRYLLGTDDAGSFDLTSFTRRITYVPQDPVLFDATALENVICLRDGITEDDAIEALKQAHLYDDLLAMPDGLQTRAGERGSRISGGQRQRLCIARALAGKPDVMILDEPTSALDPHSEEAISKTLEGLRGKVGLIFVAHRLSTLRFCDRILVLRDGKLEAQGTRDEVEAASPYFAESLRLSRLA